VDALAVGIADCGNTIVAAERVGAVHRHHDGKCQHARRARPKLPPGRLASRGHPRQYRGLHRRMALVRCRMGLQSGMDIRPLPVDAVPESAYDDFQLGRDVGRALDHVFRQQLLELVLSEPPLVEQQNLLVEPAPDVESAAAAPACSAPAAAANTTPANRATSSADRASASAVGPTARRGKASVRRAPPLGHATALRGSTSFG